MRSRDSSRVRVPVVPSVATNAKASGAPEKLASTPEAATTARRRAGRREPTTAWAMRVPKSVASRAQIKESWTLPPRPVA